MLPVKLQDMSIRKKLLLSNFMMIVIPVILVLLIMYAILMGFLAGISHSPFPNGQSWSDSNYQLQLWFDAMSEEIVEHETEFSQQDDFQFACESLENSGGYLWIQQEETTLYATNQTGSSALETMMSEIVGASLPQGNSPFFFRNGQGLVYRTQLPQTNGEPVTLTIIGQSLAYHTTDYLFLDHFKTYVKLGVVLIFGVAVIIIILTGLFLTRKLSKSVLGPLEKLRCGAIQIKEGNYNYEIGPMPQDEFGDVCRDFDEMRKRLQKSVQLQEKYETSRKELIAGISHDLSTPLTSIKGYVSGLLDGVANTPEKQTHYLQTIYRTACGMDQLVDSLFLFSKLDMGSIEFHFETVELGGYFQDYCGETAPRLELQDTSITFQHAPGIYLASLDRMQFGRAVSNLVENSIKYKRNQIPCQITITLEQADRQHLRIRFADNGRGIHPEDAPKIFDSFYRTDPARSQAIKGSGLGLAITKQIIEKLGGSISAEGIPDQGMTVTVTLPAVEQEDKHDETNFNH
ncbi:MAG: HAMP domain-containing histidine kinase [Clostridiales bacterium]|nr:HAMP domain-containing histidine kinase [Clostridiales bacterium]